MQGNHHGQIMANKISISAQLILIVLSASLTGCRLDPKIQFIQGVWSHNDPHLSNIPGESHLISQWIFDRGTFQHSACCFVTIYEHGNYSILKIEETKLTLELFNLQGGRQGLIHSKRDTMELTIVIDEDADTLKIGRESPYIRLTP
ncbi:MAG: hypothetical protein KAT23_00140 [Anaerolineales bacterium]|nr:hypothetical protein [Anaerolineales bacterium]